MKIIYYHFKSFLQQPETKYAFIGRETIKYLGADTKGVFKDISGFGRNKFYDSEQEMKEALAISDDEFEARFIAAIRIKTKGQYYLVEKQIETKQEDGSYIFERYEPKVIFVKIEEPKKLVDSEQKIESQESSIVQEPKAIQVSPITETEKPIVQENGSGLV